MLNSRIFAADCGSQCPCLRIATNKPIELQPGCGSANSLKRIAHSVGAEYSAEQFDNHGIAICSLIKQEINHAIR